MTHPMEAAGLPLAARPTARFMLSHPAHLIALGFGSGLAPVAPGTFGTLWAWLAYAVMQLWLSPFTIGIVIFASLAIGWWACAVTATHMRSPDPGPIVWDEVVSFWLILWLLTPAGFAAQLGAFLLFRLLDTFKPGPIGWADGLYVGFGWRAGFGVLFDDLVAAFCTLVLVAIAVRIWT
jgi:phosphatidylglycerophosphatase A